MRENIKNILGVTLIAAIIVASLCAIGYVYNYRRIANQSYSRSFTVTGEGKAYANPDLAKVVASVLTQGGTNIANIQTENAKKVNAIIAYLKAQKIEEKDITTEGYNLTPQYTDVGCAVGRTCPLQVSGYSIQQTISVKIRNLQTVGELLGGMVRNGANMISQLAFTVEDQDAIKNQAREQAIAKAREKADTIAQATGVKIKRLVSLYEDVNPYGGEGIGGGSSIAKGGGGDMPDVPTGSQEVRVNVSLTYEIK